MIRGEDHGSLSTHIKTSEHKFEVLKSEGFHNSHVSKLNNRDKDGSASCTQLHRLNNSADDDRGDADARKGVDALTQSFHSITNVKRSIKDYENL